MKKFINIIVVFSTVILLTGCLGIGTSSPSTGTSTSNPSNPNLSTYQGAGFTIAYPTAWEVLESTSFTSNVPTETVVVFRNNLRNEIFTSNVNITKSQIPETITPEDYGKSTLIKDKEGLVNYNEISKTALTYKVGNVDVKTFIANFEGKKTATESIVHFKQLYIVNKGTAYTITGAYLPNEDESIVKAIGEMLNSFLLK